MNAAPSATASVVLVTSEPALRQCLRFILHGMGMTVICADDVISAQAQVASGHPAMVIVDLDALGSRGFALCRNLKGIAASMQRPLHIVAISLRSTAASKAKALAMGAEVVLQKPFEPTELRRQLSSILTEP